MVIRKIAESLGGTVDWDPSGGYIRINKGDKNILLQIDNNVALVNLAHVNLDVPARLKGGRTLVPLRFIAETFGLIVNWDSVRNEINIRS